MYENFLTASVTLTNGLLHGISTIKRSDDVELIYSSNGRLLELYLPIAFTNLYFTYDYHLIILLIGPRGSLTGKIENFSMDLKLSFDFNTYHAEVESVSTRNTGGIEGIVRSVADEIVDAVNSFLDGVLHPSNEVVNAIFKEKIYLL
ncbi:hypothetical protein NQ314_009347 [Rhamnusium bicolor]|uniref:Uncharacterized protein n=1 Tax=Rhamnusium bicolor TaxID=1586634 RepID=A0AAV8Y119_9CUCU|nr:hypothetical protein NQ314_009347 [Rhamnusium bicolor]